MAPSTNAQYTFPTPEEAHATIVGIHKRAFLGRLGQLGIEPTNEKEAAALLDLGVGLLQHESQADPLEKAAAADASYDYGTGPFAQCLQAFDQVTGGQDAPGFEGVNKQASTFGQVAAAPELPPALVDSAYQAAHQLAHDPTVYGAAVVKRACNEQVVLEQYKAAGLDPQGNPIEPAT